MFLKGVELGLDLILGAASGIRWQGGGQEGGGASLHPPPVNPNLGDST